MTVASRENTIGFLHTAQVHVATFDRLLGDIRPDLHAHHLVDDALLTEARARGTIDEALRVRIGAALHAVHERAAVVVCTCSTIGGIVEEEHISGRIRAMRIDRAMADRAVSIGSRILVVIALASTADPSLELLRESARRAGTNVDLELLRCEDVWEEFTAGRVDNFRRSIAARVAPRIDSFDAIVLAQASMTGAELMIPNQSPKVLSSPRLGVEAAIELLAP